MPMTLQSSIFPTLDTLEPENQRGPNMLLMISVWTCKYVTRQ
jgi:hypothetical protein